MTDPASPVCCLPPWVNLLRIQRERVEAEFENDRARIGFVGFYIKQEANEVRYVEDPCRFAVGFARGLHGIRQCPGL